MAKGNIIKMQPNGINVLSFFSQKLGLPTGQGLLKSGEGWIIEWKHKFDADQREPNEEVKFAYMVNLVISATGRPKAHVAVYGDDDLAHVLVGFCLMENVPYEYFDADTNEICEDCAKMAAAEDLGLINHAAHDETLHA